MTIRKRNNALWTLTIISVASLAMSVVLLIAGVKAHHFVINSSGNPVFGYNTRAVIISLFAILIYVVVSSRFMLVKFEKTQSTEIVYLLLFTFAVLSDTVRLYVPFFGLYQAASSAVNAIGRALLFGRTLAPLSLIFAAAFSETRERTNTDRNCIILVGLAVAVSVTIPVNTAIIEQNFAPRWGEGHIVATITALLLFTAILSFFISAHTQGAPFRCPISVASLSLGYSMLCHCVSFFMLIAGTGALFCGTIFYLQELHKQYMWK